MNRRSSRGMTLLEVMVSLVIIVMVSLLIYGAFDSLSRGKKGEAMRVDRARQGREAVLRIVREMTSAYLSLHFPQTVALQTRYTAFVGRRGRPFDRVDFASFVHRRMEKDAKESDQAEVGYFVVPDPDNPDKNDLVRREQTPLDISPLSGGVVDVMVENVEGLEFRYLDPTTSTWLDSWDTTQSTGQANRLPLEIKVTLRLKAVPGAAPLVFTTKFFLPNQTPLSFGIIQ